MNHSNLTHTKRKLVHDDPWVKLRQFTNARIGIGRVGTSIPTDELLRFQLSHAQAIDAVHVPLNVVKVCQQFEQTLILQPLLPVAHLHSEARNRMEYLQRPDLGRKLNEASLYKIQQLRNNSQSQYDLVFVIADGLSSYAIANHAKSFLELMIKKLNDDPQKDWNIAPIVIVEQGRVAVGDDVCETLNAKEVVLLVGERPGLSSPDSMGIYITWHAVRGNEESLRNCISNIRPEGLNYPDAVHKCHYLLSESHKLELTGVTLKDRSDDGRLTHQSEQYFCLTTSD